MSGELFISEILFAIIISIGILVLYQLIRSKNGTLRKIMIGYFAVEIWLFSWSAVYYYLAEQGTVLFSAGTLRLIVLVPKAVIKIMLLVWLVKQNSKK